MAKFFRKLGVQIGNLYIKIANWKQTPKFIRLGCLAIFALLTQDCTPVVVAATEFIPERSRKSDED